MGLLINAEWQEHEPDIARDDHQRQKSAFRAMPGRYHLYV